MYPIKGLTFSGFFVTSIPMILADPSVGVSNPHNIRIVVVFPLPFGPRYPNTSPGCTVKETWSTAVKLPNFFVNPITSSGRIWSFIFNSFPFDQVNEHIFQCSGERDDVFHRYIFRFKPRRNPFCWFLFRTDVQ